MINGYQESVPTDQSVRLVLLIHGLRHSSSTDGEWKDEEGPNSRHATS